MRNTQSRKGGGYCYRFRILLMVSIATVAIVSCWYSIALLHTDSPLSPLRVALSSSTTRTVKHPEKLLGRQGLAWAKIENGKRTEISIENGNNPLVHLLQEQCDNTSTIQNNITICVNGTLPRFQHKLPNFVPHTTDQEIFLLQPENIQSMVKDWMDTSWETCFVFFSLRNNSSIMVTARIVGVQSFWFQHFHDNALPFIYQARQGLDAMATTARKIKNCILDKRILYEQPARGSETLREEWSMLGFTKQELYQTARFRQVSNRLHGGISIVRQRHPRDADQVRLHPLHAQWFQRNLPLPTTITTKQKKIIWISRQGAQKKGIFARQCSNEDEVIQHLKRHVTKSEVLVYNPSSSEKLTTVQQLVNYFANVRAIVGIHGGGMYNQFFSRQQPNIIELFPVNDQGLIHGQQTNRSTPQIAHRSIWHNSNALGQPYWRIHVVATNAKEFEIPMTTMDSVVRALELSNCID